MALVRHQHRKGHGAEHASCGAAEYEFAETGVTVATHHHEVGASVEGVRQESASRLVGACEAAKLGFEPVPGEMALKPASRRIGVLAIVGHRHDFDPLRF